MRVVVPFDARRPKTRLEGVLSAAERDAFARAMLRDVLGAVRVVGGTPEVLATAPVEADAPVTVDDRSLTGAVNAVLAAADPRETPLAVVMADLALATPAALGRLLAADADVVLVPGRGGGTNAVVTRHPAFRVDYHGASIRDHRRAVNEADATLAELDSFRLATDVDEPEDLAEVLLHGRGEAREWLADAGFDLRVADGRTAVSRPESD